MTIDVGNTNVVVGCFEGEELKVVLRLKTDSEQTIDEYEALLFSLIARKFGEVPEYQQAIISSVVPPLTPLFTRLIQRTLGITPLIVGPGIKTGVSIKTNDPSAVGSDRIVNSVAAKILYGSPALVIDFGTATSFDVVDKEGDYIGGIIAPGVVVALNALVEHTAKLPRIELGWPENVIGRNTVSAMQSGAVVGYLCMVEGLIEKIKKETPGIKHIIATGGVGRLFSKHSEQILHYEPEFTLQGLRILAEMNP